MSQSRSGRSSKSFLPCALRRAGSAARAASTARSIPRHVRRGGEPEVDGDREALGLDDHAGDAGQLALQPSGGAPDRRRHPFAHLEPQGSGSGDVEAVAAGVDEVRQADPGGDVLAAAAGDDHHREACGQAAEHLAGRRPAGRRAPAAPPGGRGCRRSRGRGRGGGRRGGPRSRPSRRGRRGASGSEVLFEVHRGEVLFHRAVVLGHGAEGRLEIVVDPPEDVLRAQGVAASPPCGTSAPPR